MKYSFIVCSFFLLLFYTSPASEESIPTTMEKYSHERDCKAVEKFGVQLPDATFLDVLRSEDRTVGYIHYNIITQNNKPEGHIISWNIARDTPHSYSAQTIKQLLNHAITALRGLNAQKIKVSPLPNIEKRFIESVDNENEPVLIRVDNLYKELNLIIEEPMQESWLQYAGRLLFFWKKDN